MKIQRLALYSLCLSAIAATAGPVAAATTYNATFLEGLPDSVFTSAVDIGPSGTVVGTATISGAVLGLEYDIDHAVLWNEAGQIMELAPPGSNISSGVARSINKSGQVLVILDGIAYRWSNGTLTNLTALGLTGSISAMNDAGVIAGYRPNRAFIWNNGVTTDLPLLQNFAGRVVASDIDNLDQVVGYAELPGIYAGITRAVVWDNGAIQDLGTLPDDTHSYAYGINDVGQIVGVSAYSYTSTGLLRNPSTRSFLWSNGVMTDIGSLEPNSINTIAVDINNVGQIVGSTVLPAKGSEPTRAAAFVWNNGTMTNLNLALGRDGCYPSAINDAGQIVGSCGGQAFKLTPVAPGVDMGVRMAAASGAAAQGGAFTYLLTATNSGSLPASGVSITDVLPAGFDFVAASASQGTCTGTTTIVCAVGDIASDASATVQLTVRPTVLGMFANSVSVAVNEADVNSVNNTASASVVVKTAQDTADLGISMTASPNPATSLANLTYAITVTNSGAGTANNVSVIDSLPSNVKFISVSGSQGTCTGITFITCSFGSIASGASASATIVIQPRATGVIPNTAGVYSSTSDVNAANNSATANVVVNASTTATADLALTMTDRPDPVRKGKNLTYTITVRNNGPATATALLVSDTLSPFVSYASSTTSQGSCTATPTTVIEPGSNIGRNTTAVACTLGNLANGASATVTIVVRPQLTGTITNLAGVTASSNDTNTVNNAVSISTRVR